MLDVKLVKSGCNHERKLDRFATLSQRSMTGVMFAGMKEDREP